MIFVTAADNLHNARAIFTDVRSSGPDTLNRVTVSRIGTVAYYSALLEVLSRKHGPVILARPLDLIVGYLHVAVPTWRRFPALLNLFS